MDKELHGEVLKSHTEMVVLRLLVESILSALPLEQQGVALWKYSQACERLVSDMLGGTAREELVNAVDRAVKWQALRLGNLGLEVPSPHAD